MKKIMLLISLLVCGAFAKDTVNVVVHEIAPMVMEGTDGSVRGFDIDVFNRVAADMDVVPNYIVVPKFTDVFKYIDEGKADYGVAGITINYKRSQNYEFSYPYKKSGLGVLVRDEYEVSLIDNILELVISKDFVRTFISFLIFFIVAAHVIWFTERGSDAIADKYLDKNVDESGIEESAWFLIAAVTTMGFGDITVKKRLSRICVVAVAVIGFTLFASLMGQFSAISVGQMERYAINGIDDLRGKSVAVVGGTTSELDNIGAIITKAKDSKEALLLLEAKRVDAVVFDAPTLQYYAKINENVITVGGMFDLQDYGIIMKKGNPKKEMVSMSVLKYIESEDCKLSQLKWFGKND